MSNQCQAKLNPDTAFEPLSSFFIWVSNILVNRHLISEALATGISMFPTSPFLIMMSMETMQQYHYASWVHRFTDKYCLQETLKMCMIGRKYS